MKASRKSEIVLVLSIGFVIIVVAVYQPMGGLSLCALGFRPGHQVHDKTLIPLSLPSTHLIFDRVMRRRTHVEKLVRLIPYGEIKRRPEH